jgi:hypothetical protein
LNNIFGVLMTPRQPFGKIVSRLEVRRNLLLETA